MIGVALIPALYNIIFLSSMWDPYGQVSDLPVAVVNKDQSATYNGQKDGNRKRHGVQFEGQ